MHWGPKVPGSFLSSRAATVGFLRRRPFRVVRQERTHANTHLLLLMLHVLDSTFMFCRDSVSKYRSTLLWNSLFVTAPSAASYSQRDGDWPNALLALVRKTPSPRGCYLFESTLTKICVYLKKFPCARFFPLCSIKLPLFIPRKPVGDWRTNST